MNEHLHLLLYISSIATAKSALVVCLLFYLRFRQRILLNFFFFIYGIALLTYKKTVSLYSILTGVPQDDPFLVLLGLMLFITGMAVMTLNYPLFGFELYGKKPLISHKLVFALLLTFTIVLSVMAFIFPGNRIILLLQTLLLIISYLLFVGAGLISFIQNPRDFQKQIKAIFFLTAFLSFPILIPIEIFSVNFAMIFLLTISLGTIIIGFTVFRMPSGTDRNSLTEKLKNQFLISQREAEITWFLLNGLSAKRIGRKLYISTKTVQNHTAKIYQKTGVNSRFQLIQLINARIGISYSASET